MQQVEFTSEEAELLREILSREDESIEIEIFRTDTHDFKEKLKRRRGLLEHLLQKIPPTPVQA
jgi:TnpA family transposase